MNRHCHRNLLALALGATLLFAPALYGQVEGAGDDRAQQELAAAGAGEFLTIGDTAPALDIAHWLKGSEVSEFEAGRVYVVNFWSTWCKFCHSEMHRLTELQEDYKLYDVSVLAVSDEKLQTVFRFISRPEWNRSTGFAVATDPDKSTQRDYMVAAGIGEIPVAFIVGYDGLIEWIGHPREAGTVLRRVVDDTWDRDAFRDEFEEGMQQAYAFARTMRKLRDTYRARDWDQLLPLFDEAIEQAARPVELQVQKFMLMVGEMEQPDAGYALGRELVKTLWDDAEALNVIAWFVVDSDFVAVRDLDFAMTAASRAAELTKRRHAAILDTLARVHFEQGHLEDAIRIQREAVEVLEPDDPVAEAVRAALRRYQGIEQQSQDS